MMRLLIQCLVHDVWSFVSIWREVVRVAYKSQTEYLEESENGLSDGYYEENSLKYSLNLKKLKLSNIESNLKMVLQFRE